MYANSSFFDLTDIRMPFVSHSFVRSLRILCVTFLMCACLFNVCLSTSVRALNASFIDSVSVTRLSLYCTCKFSRNFSGEKFFILRYVQDKGFMIFSLLI